MSNNNAAPKKLTRAQSRRTWNAHEERQLIDGLKELVSRGYKSDNGFRTGYLNLLEQYLSQRFPGTDLKAEPHISSKIHNWKRSYTSLSGMFGTSGIGLGPNMMIDVLDDVWEAYLKIDPTVLPMRYKTWPYYNDWIEIFGKDRATGEHAQGFADAMKDFLNTGTTEPHTSSFVKTPNPNEGSSNAFTSMGNSTSSGTSLPTGKVKQRRGEYQTDDPYMARITQYCENNDKQMGDIALNIGDIAKRKKSKLDPSDKRMNVYNLLEGFEFPSLKDRVHVARYLCNNEADLDFFMSIPEDARDVLLKDIMEKI